LTLDNLIKQCKIGNREAQEMLYELYKDKLFTLSLKYCRSYEEAEDNLQDVFLIILKSIKKYKGKGSFEGWLKRITINKAINRYKNEPYNHTIKEEVIETSEVQIRHSDLNLSIDNILLLIQELPDRYRLVFNLYELDDYKHHEIANMLSISEGTSKSNLHRAKVLLKKKIREQNDNLKKKPI